MIKWLIAAGLMAYTVVEIALLLELGRWAGLTLTLAWTVGSALLGLGLLRVEGLRGLIRIHRQLQQEVLPTLELVDMTLIVLGSVLLILPGLLSDIVGLLLFFPPARWLVRTLFFSIVGNRLPTSPDGPSAFAGDVIEIQAEPPAR
jgi:UPF0716 protein FxsA